MTRFKVNLHEPRVVEQKYTTLTVNVKEIESSTVAREIKSKLDSIMPGIIQDAGGQLTIEKAIKNNGKDAKLTNAELVQKKVVGPVRARKAKKIDAKVGA
jgi:hypothetical protein